MGALLGATIALSMQDGGVPAAVDKVTANLSSAERAGRRAESAAQAASKGAADASSAAGDLTRRAVHSLRELRHAVHLLEKAAKFAGADEGSAVGIGLEALSGGAQLARFGAKLGGPAGALLGFGVGAGFSAYSAYSKSTAEAEKHAREQADKDAEALVKALGRQRDANLDAIIREQAGLKHVASQFGGVRESL